MFEFIFEQIKWVFSGIGVGLAAAVWTVYRRWRRKSYAGDTRGAIQWSMIEPPNSEPEPGASEVELISKRFRTVLGLMNQDRRVGQITISQLAQAMRLTRISELENVFTRGLEPDIQLMRTFSEICGVNFNWLAHGSMSPFSNNDRTNPDPMANLRKILDLRPVYIYFIRENSERAPAFIVLKLSKWKFKILQRTWPVSDQVGSAGANQLVGLYRLINGLKSEGYYSKCGGLTLDRDDFSELLGGDMYPGQFVDGGEINDPWWDDLTDVYHKYPIARHYADLHGRSFTDAQEIIRSMLEVSD